MKYNNMKYNNNKMLNNNTQITPIKGYDTNKIMFSEPILGSIPDSKPKIEFKRINISTKNDDGSVGELIIPTSRLFSFGVSENTSQETGKINGYTFPLCLWNKDGHSEEEKEWTDLFDKIVDKCIDHLVENKEEIDMFDLTRSDLTKSKGGLNPLYWKKEKRINDKGKTEMINVPNSGPTIYTKLIFSKKNDKFLSQFFDVNDEQINALDLMGKYCYTKAAIKIESIFIGSKISLQVKLYEAVVEPITNGMKRLLRPTAQPTLSIPDMSSLTLQNNTTTDENDDDDGSLILTDDENTIEVLKEPPPAPRKIKKIVKK
jgi:hypothetical protein